MKTIKNMIQIWKTMGNEENEDNYSQQNMKGKERT